MDNRTDSISMTVLTFIIFFGFILITIFGFIGMLIAFIVMTSYMDNFVLRPLSKSLSAKNYMPTNYMYRKLQNTRLVIWIISMMIGFPFIFVIEMLAIMISFAKINELKRKMGEPITSFSKYDYLIYEEYSKFSEDDEYNEYENEKNDDEYTQRKEYSYDDVIDEQDVKVNVVEEYNVKKDNFFDTSETRRKVEIIVKTETLEDKEEKLKKEIEEIKNELYKTITEEPKLKDVQKFDFDKPVEEIQKIEPIKTDASSVWDKPVGDIFNSSNVNGIEKLEPADDEICCEKCGTVMSKMKIACPKCGALVKNSYKSGK